MKCLDRYLIWIVVLWPGSWLSETSLDWADLALPHTSSHTSHRLRGEDTSVWARMFWLEAKSSDINSCLPSCLRQSLVFIIVNAKMLGPQVSGHSPVFASHLTIGALGLQVCTTLSDFMWVLVIQTHPHVYKASTVDSREEAGLILGHCLCTGEVKV